MHTSLPVERRVWRIGRSLKHSVQGLLVVSSSSDNGRPTVIGHITLYSRMSTNPWIRSPHLPLPRNKPMNNYLISR
jgi:hypothetical protein